MTGGPTNWSLTLRPLEPRPPDCSPEPAQTCSLGQLGPQLSWAQALQALLQEMPSCGLRGRADSVPTGHQCVHSPQGSSVHSGCHTGALHPQGGAAAGSPPFSAGSPATPPVCASLVPGAKPEPEPVQGERSAMSHFVQAAAWLFSPMNVAVDVILG